MLPGGSTNVFARTIGMTNDPIEATGELLAALGAGPGGIRAISVGNVNGRHFLFHVGVGFDAAVVAQVERALGPQALSSVTPSSPTRPSTPGPATTTGATPTSRPSCTAATGTTVMVEDGYFAICLKTNPYTFLGDRPFDVAPGTGLDSPLSVVVLRSLSAANMLGLVAAALRGGGSFGRHAQGDRRRRRGAGNVSRPYAPVPYQVDGDYLGDTEHLEFRWEPDHLRARRPGGR